MKKCIREILLPNTGATEKLGKALATAMTAGLVIYLQGDLGAGKTTLARALLYAMGHKGAVKSPTYAVVEVYVVSRLYFYHFDFYRFTSPEEFFDAGLDEYFRQDAICLVEWPEKAAGCAPEADVRLCLSIPSAELSEESRVVAFSASSQEGERCLKQCFAAWDAGISASESPG
ncbi:MAG: tRNA (adenosine(37)-N6)-threonylcarbamoyltransferase complex ATPase subunit type 1 TsaE [Betaproteobacteria bacterium]|nr:tRNA (adenosine(37)-N6)-threonylcarbamoyltransferase complex ATPase subunit type 1 TsaE [Betaproteobacteria bacterium]